MHINSLVSEIRRGLWAIGIHNIEAYMPIVEKLASGQPFNFDAVEKASSLLAVIDSKGRVKPEGPNGLDVAPNSIAQVCMYGEVIKNGDWCTYGADEIVGALYAADEHPNFDATVFRIDGPGGAVSAIDLFRDFGAAKTKPVIGLLGDALSLHYWAAVEVCDYLISDGNVSPRFGSVGVMASWMDFIKELEARGIVQVEVYSSHSEHKNDAFRLAREGKFDMIKTEHLDPLALKFQESVINGRQNLKQEVGVLTGKTFYADEALRLGMIDEIGNINTAITKARAFALNSEVSKLK